MKRSERALLLLVPLLIGGAIAASYVAPYLLSPIEADLARDLYRGYRITAGQEWPASGPLVGDSWHLGPAWYYVLAAALLVFHSIAGAVASVGVLAALKFPLAWRLGCEWVDARFGFTWAIMLALPGIPAFESIWVAHPSLVAAASLAVVFALWRAVERRSYPWMFAACFGFGLALHAHPTTLPLGLLIALALPRIATRGAGQPWKILLCAALVLLPFAPLLADVSTHARDFAAFARGITSALEAFRPGSAIPIAANIFWHVPNLVVDSYLGDVAAIGVVWRVFLATMHVVVLVGIGLALARSDLDLRPLAAAALSYTLFSALVVVGVRNETRFYMVYALMPSIALAQAIGLTACTRSGWPGARVLVDVLLGATIVGFVAVAGARFVQAAEGHVRLPALFGGQMDLRTGPKVGFALLDSLPAWDLDALGRALCSAGPVRAFGDLTIIVDSQFNVPARAHCGEKAQVVLGGLPAPGERALYLLSAAALTDADSAQRYGALRLGTVESIPYPGRGVALASGDAYPARPACAPASVHRIDFTARAEKRIVVATALPTQCPITLRRVTVGGRDVVPTRHLLSYFLDAPAGSTENGWHLEIETGDIGAVQVFTTPKAR